MAEQVDRGKVDWLAIAVEDTDEIYSQETIAEALRTRFEPLVRAAEDEFASHVSSDKQVQERTLKALRAALDALPKVGG